MPGIFMSHSSRDKPLVTRLAADLVYDGFSVWLDSWEIEAGDSLLGRIFDGIDASTFVLVALSSASLQSAWVRKELLAALAREDQLGRKVVIPLRLELCDLPTAIADRLYADFTVGYTTALERLKAILRKAGAANIKVPLRQELIPLKFTKSIYLQKPELQARIEQLASRISQDERISSAQIFLVPDEPYGTLRASLAELVDTIADHPKYSPELEEYVQRAFRTVTTGEKALSDGLAALANGLADRSQIGFFTEAAHWFTRLIRNAVMVQFERVRPLLNASAPSAPIPPIELVLASDAGTARFYELNSVLSLDVFREANGPNIRIMVDRDSEVGEWFITQSRVPDRLRAFWHPTLVYKYLVPQMLIRHFWLDKMTPLVWDFSDWMIGPA